MHDERKLAWRTMSVIYCHNWMGKALAERFSRRGIPIQWMKSTADKRQFDSRHESVKLMTMHSSKGLEFETVAACGIGYMGKTEDRLLQDAKLLYVAMTRATRNLLLTSSEQGELTQKLHLAAEALASSHTQKPVAAESEGIDSNPSWFRFLNRKSGQ
jgi:superfamily I DNA/RNA helicase